MNRVLYLMHVPWGWIKQRPHFLAEQLGKHRHVDVYCPDQELGKNLVSDQPVHGVTVRLFHPDAFLGRGASPEFVERLHDYDVVYLCSPLFYPLVEGRLSTKQVLVYDAMDDHLAFPDVNGKEFLRELYRSTEAKLLSAATLVLASSEHLRQTLNQRHQNSRAIHCVFNAFSPHDWQSETLPATLAAVLDAKLTNMVYVGTVSEWLDYPTLLESLQAHAKVRCILVGPLEVTLPVHARLMHVAPIPHRDVYPLMKHADLLLLPFIDNALVQSADPVKVYEYIYSGVPSLVLGYGETDKFADYVHTYRGRAEFIDKVGQAARGALLSKKSAEDCIAFGKQNTWGVRMREQLEPLLMLAKMKAETKALIRSVIGRR